MTTPTQKLAGIQLASWANVLPSGALDVPGGSQLFKMCNSDATGTPLLKSGDFGADTIRFGENEGVGPHTHEGDHILFVIKGFGFVDYEGVAYDLKPGICYFIPGEVEHAIRATTELILIAVGNKHRPLDSEERMTPIS